MTFIRLKLAMLAGVASLAAPWPAFADVNILYLSDMSGPTSVLTGESSQRAIEMAIDDFGGEVNGEKIVLHVADHLSKPDVALGIAREFVDKGDLNLLFSVDHSAAAQAVSDLVRDKNLTFIASAAAMPMINEKCGPRQVQMLMDSYGLSRAITVPLVEAGLKKWYYITVDYAFGQDLQAFGESALAESGGELVGSAKHSPQTTDFSAFLLEAQAKGADAIGLATFGAWQIAIAKQAQEFGITIPLAPYLLGDTDIKAAGLESFQNVSGAIQFYWDQNDKTREFAKRFQERYSRPPTFTNAMAYEMITHYLKAADEAGNDDATEIVKKMREAPIQMINGDTASIREDGRTMRPMYSFVTKTPQESKGDWDYLKITGKIDADKIAPPLSGSKCPLVKS
ncbi:ABC transporter substrate-binding protein [Mesorhizobium australicum]|uniref:Branched-chain amino acid transport system substrate-binding protein n=1 Tax=Mesorhizobium australicum TaxID=536018 RepID=A0A1X7PR62_9HYPH|nr:ABC transporter substrate-binding protein [Mesorhizobium australicum]SMH54571.1 branched-chain amino acid transport system substrate-binding protein [Mesorhizobium australicum]